MRFRLFLYSKSLIFLSGLLAFAFATPGFSEDTAWGLYNSDSGIFQVRFPKEFKKTSSEVRIDDQYVLYTTEIVGEIDERPEKGIVKNYLVREEQTFGKALTGTDMKKLLAQESLKYKKLALDMGGVLLNNEEVEIEGFLGREMYIAYGPEDKRQGIKVKVMYTDKTKVQQVLTGPGSSIFSYKSNEFFNSLQLHDGMTAKAGSIEKEWRSYTSPFGIFTIKVPPKAEPFITRDFKFKTYENHEVGQLLVHDPVFNYKTIYNVYGYKFDKPVSPRDVQSLMYSKHIVRYVPGLPLSEVNTLQKKTGGYDILSTRVSVRPNKKYPYLDTALIEAHFKGNIVVVQELLGKEGHVLSPLGKSLFSQLVFHPEQVRTLKESSALPTKAQEILDPEIAEIVEEEAAEY